MEDIEAKRLKTKNTLIKYSVCFLILCLVCLGLVLLRYFTHWINITHPLGNVFCAIADGVSLGGAVGVVVWLFIYVQRLGAFDLMSYGIAQAFNAIFRRNPVKAMKKSYAEYVESKRDKRKDKLMFILYVSLFVLIVGIILLAIYSNNK